MKTIKNKQYYLIFPLIILMATHGFSQNFKGGIDDGYSASSNVNFNLNNIAEYFSVTITMADGQLNPCNTSIINFKATFNKNTNNFSGTYVTIYGTANPTTVVVTGGPLVYNMAVSGMTNDGSVIVHIPSGVCNDEIVNSLNAASINQQNEVFYDLQKPSPTITLSSGQPFLANNSPVNFTTTFTEPVIGFDSSDITIGGTAGATSVVLSGTGPYNLAVSGMTSDGTVTVSINAGVCSDLAGNLNTASLNVDNSVAYDISRPGVTISKAVGQSDPTGFAPVNFIATFTEPVTGFDASDISIGGTAGATLVVISGTGPYNLSVGGMTSDGTVTVSINAGVCSDPAGNFNTGSVNNDNLVVFDITRPTIEITLDPAQPNPTNNAVIAFSLNFSESTVDLQPTNIIISGTSGANSVHLTGGPQIYKAEVSGMSNSGSVTITIPQNVTTDLAGNYNQPSLNTNNTVFYDNIKPDAVVSSSATNPTLLSEIPIRIEFSESVTGLNANDISITNGTINSLTETESGLIWDGFITADVPGNIIIQLPAGAVFDAAGNNNSASNQFQIEYTSDETDNFEATNIFTPNSNLNRYWTLKNVERYTEYQLVIRNGSGQIVYQTTNYQNDWNGTYKNKPLPTGTYYYFLSNSSKNIVYKGFVNIIYE